MQKIVVRERVFIPIDSVNIEDVDKHYTRKAYEESACAGCMYLTTRHCYTCDECSSYLGEVKMYREQTLGGVDYVGLPIGDKRLLERRLGIDYNDFKILDRRVLAEFEYKIKFTAQLRDYQEKLETSFMKKKYGLLEAPPRTGKCVEGDSLLFTEDGIIEIQDWFSPSHKDGEVVEFEKELLTRSSARCTEALYKKKVDKIIRVKTSMGFSVGGTFEHPVLVLKPDLSLEWVKLQDIELGDVLCIRRGAQYWTNNTYTTEGISITNDLSRLLGYLIANGNLNYVDHRVSFTTNNVKVQKDFLSILKRCFSISTEFKFDRTVYGCTLTAKNPNYDVFINTLTALGLDFVKSGKKSVPASVLKSNESIVNSFLSAYFSCDSWLGKRDTDPIQLCSASKKLMRQIHVILVNYGIVGKFSSSISWARNSNNPVKRRYYNILIFSSWKNIFYSTFSLFKKKGSLSVRTDADFDKIPYLGQALSECHSKAYVRTGVYVCENGTEATSRAFGKLVQDHSKSPSELPKDLNWRVADRINLDLLAVLDSELCKRVEKLKSLGYYFDKITKVKVVDRAIEVFDVSVPSNRSFVANGLVVHNTITMLKLCLNLGQKTLFLADQYEFITQFIDHIEGNEKEGIPKCTNLPELQKKYGKKLYGIPKTDEDYENFQIFTLPYQQFASKNGKARFDKIKHLIGTVVVDEVHSAAAPVFARVISMFPARYKFGVTGTVTRKDKKHYVIKSILGPIVAKTTIDSLIPIVHVHETKIPTTKSKAWVFIMKHLCSNADRNKLIVDQIMRDLKAGRNIVMPVIFRNHALELQREVNRRFGSKICELFVGGGGEKNKNDRKRILQQAKAGTTRVVIGIRRLLQRGLNVPQWDTIYEVIPISNKPNLKQETSRIRTPLDGKLTPMIRLFFDPNVGASMGCARSTLNHMKEFGYDMDKTTAPLMYKILSSGNRRQSIFDDETPVNLLDLEEKGMFTSL